MNTKGIAGHTRQIMILDLMLKKNRIPQTILFSGISGIGKKEIALRFLGAIFCKESNSPCLKCSTCIQIRKGTFPDIIQLHPNEKGIIQIGDPNRKEAGSVRWLIDLLSRKSISGKYGILINGIDRISRDGITALLKTIEEPQKGTCIIMLAENRSQLPLTILSRCMGLPFSPLQYDDVKRVLKDIDIDSLDYGVISIISGGSVKLASLLSNDKLLDSIGDLCSDISKYLDGEGYLKLDLKEIQKILGMEDLLTLLTNIYRTMLLSKIKSIKLEPFFSDIEVSEIWKLKKLIKIFLALRDGFSNNLNIRNSLKGMLYSINRISETGVPKLDFLNN